MVDAILAGGAAGILVPSEDGGEVFQFTASGRHLRTLDALTGALRFEFDYDLAGRLEAVLDGDGNVTAIDHDPGGATTITGPFGQRTDLTVNSDGFLGGLTTPAGEVIQMTYTPDGLLTALTGPRGQTSRYEFNADGRLTSATNATGATKTLASSGARSDRTVTITTALGRTTSYHLENMAGGDVRLTTTDPAGANAQALFGADGVLSATLVDGTTLRTVLGPTHAGACSRRSPRA